MLDNNNFHPRLFHEKFDGQHGGAKLGQKLTQARLPSKKFRLSEQQLPSIPKEEVSGAPTKVSGATIFGIAVSVAKSPTLFGTAGHMFFQAINAPLMLGVQLTIGCVSIYNEIREKHFSNEKYSREKFLTQNNLHTHASDGSWTSFALDLGRSPALQRIFEGVFYGVSALAIASSGYYYLSTIFATGAIASLANAYYMNMDVNYWQAKKLPRAVSGFFLATEKLPAFVRNLLSNPGLWACIADSMIALHGVVEKGQVVKAISDPFAAIAIGVGVSLCAMGFFQAINAAWKNTQKDTLVITDKSIATAISGVGALSFGIGNILLQNYMIAAALLLWSAQSFLMAARIDKVEKMSKFKKSA